MNFRIDETIANDGEWSGTSPFNRSWNTFWESAAIRTADGWCAEMRIPFSSLRFQADGDRVVMGIITWRHIARKKEVAAFPSLPPSVTRGQFKPSLAADVELHGVTPRRSLLITPYLLTGQTRTVEIDESDNGKVIGYSLLQERLAEAGLDLKYGLKTVLSFLASRVGSIARP